MKAKIFGFSFGVLFVLVILLTSFTLFNKNNTTLSYIECPPANLTRHQSSTDGSPSIGTPSIGNGSPSVAIDNESMSTKDALLQKYFKKIFTTSLTDIYSEQFTILIMTYKRTSILQHTIPHYCSTGAALQKIIIVWNNVGSDIPTVLTDIKCAAKLVFIKSKQNKLTNRFIPYNEIQTEAVAIIDDDRKILIPDLLLGFQTWQQFRYRIVGYEHRTHDRLSDGTYYYGTKPGYQSEKYGYSAMISATFIMHKAYLEMFHDPTFLPQSIYDYINTNMNCEDLAMCIMVTDFLIKTTYPQTCCVSVKTKKYPINLEATNREGYRGLSMRGTHYNKRSECLTIFSKSYPNHELPLVYTHIRASHDKDSYYKDN